MLSRSLISGKQVKQNNNTKMVTGNHQPCDQHNEITLYKVYQLLCSESPEKDKLSKQTTIDYRA